MDFKLFLGVVKRYKRVVISGTVVAVVLSVLSYGMPGLKGGKPTIIPRGSELWQGNAEVLISQAGFPYGRAVQQVIPGQGAATPPETIGDLGYMSNLSSVYAALANGDSVQHQVATEAHVLVCPVTTSATGALPAATGTGGCGSVVANSVEQPGTGAALPLITLTASAPTAAEAAKLTTTTIAVLRSEVAQQQAAASTSASQRVVLETVNNGVPATLVQGHSKSIPMLVLFAVVSASIALAFILNNHSDDPVRSTRRRPDERLGHDGVALAGTGNGHVAEPDHGLAQTSGARMKLIGLRRGASGTRLADEENAGTQRAAVEGLLATDGRRASSDRTPPHLQRGSRFEAESRD